MLFGRHTGELLKMTILEEAGVGNSTCMGVQAKFRCLCLRKICYLPRWAPLRQDPARTVRRNSSLEGRSTI